ncbi:MAG: hypothetical protein ACO1OB_28530 [Archangium sp.]
MTALRRTGATVLVGIGLLLIRQNFRDMAAYEARREVRTNLKACHQALKSSFEQHGRHPVDFTDMEFIPERGNRFVYVFTGGAIQRRETNTS